MLEIFAYALSVMYSPGPVNILCLNAGVNQAQGKRLRFCAGVGLAMFILSITFGFLGTLVVKPSYQIVISIAGAMYILWLAFKIAKANTDVRTGELGIALDFKTGFTMQILNPKAFGAILPMVSVLFPANGITGPALVLVSAMMGLLAVGAPGSYLLLGRSLGGFIQSAKILRYFNLMMAVMLLYVALEILYRHVITPMY